MERVIFEWNTRVYFEDTDSGGVVYHANYLKFMERARTEWLRSLGLNQIKLKKEDKMMFIVRKVDIQYKIPARFNDELLIQTDCVKITDYSVLLKQNILRDKQTITEGKVEIVCINSELFKPIRIPKMAKQLMEII
ncbi:tol-pal system-associated acyl-CoA thioesterase [Methylophilaceae bacterium]|jgi:acyl-CoA thioester hydrolase|nr:tol-pal system-associated acyl-CoA thioesterase [Methylophilaceae bacterium]|tara:strand:- start:121 stop:528 length:408 start_codon:yes stop_codon:yes gene_type:complete